MMKHFIVAVVIAWSCVATTCCFANDHVVVHHGQPNTFVSAHFHWHYCTEVPGDCVYFDTTEGAMTDADGEGENEYVDGDATGAGHTSVATPSPASFTAGGVHYTVSGGSKMSSPHWSVAELVITGDYHQACAGTITFNVTGAHVKTGRILANVFIGSGGSGQLWQMSLDSNGSQVGSIPNAMGQLLDGAPISISFGDSNYAFGDQNQPLDLAYSGPDGQTYNCGDSLTITVTVTDPNESPTPAPSVSPTATVSPFPSPSPSPSMAPTATPVQYSTPPANDSGSGGNATTVTHSGTTMSGITNQDIYNDVKQALNDAGNNTTGAPGVGQGFEVGGQPGGGEGEGSGDSERNGIKSDVTNSITKTNGIISKGQNILGSSNNIVLPNSGVLKSWSVNLPKLGELTVDLAPFDTQVTFFRNVCLFALYCLFWFLTLNTLNKSFM